MVGWIPPRTSVTGEMHTSAMLNETRDLLRFIGQSAQAFKTTDKTVNTTAYADVDTNTDLMLSEVTAGDRIKVGLSYRPGNATAFAIYHDAVTLVGGVPVNYISGLGSGGVGVSSWFMQSGVSDKAGGAIMYDLVAGDLVANTVTLRIRAKLNAAGSRVIQASLQEYRFWAETVPG